MLFVYPFILCNIANRIYRTWILSNHCRDSHSDYLIITCLAFVFNLTSLNLQKTWLSSTLQMFHRKLLRRLCSQVDRHSGLIGRAFVWHVGNQSSHLDRDRSDSYISTANVFGNRCRILIPLLFFLFSFDILWCWWITAERLVLKTINYC